MSRKPVYEFSKPSLPRYLGLNNNELRTAIAVAEIEHYMKTMDLAIASALWSDGNNHLPLDVNVIIKKVSMRLADRFTEKMAIAVAADVLLDKNPLERYTLKRKSFEAFIN
ncbi:hypothetical protein [Proteus mirabilis]|uniref:hypothetical protein n=1 Tax=Proteus mirabilis TaxID=584 RepID=UPI0034D42A04